MVRRVAGAVFTMSRLTLVGKPSRKSASPAPPLPPLHKELLAQLVV